VQGRPLAAVALATLAVASAGAVSTSQSTDEELPVHVVPNLGEAAEFYFSPDSKWLIGNAKRAGDAVHHVYVTNLDGTEIRRINDKGEDACSFFMPDGKHVVWTSTRDWPELPKGTWSNPKDYPRGAELYVSDLAGQHVRRLTRNQLYDAEVGASPDGRFLVFGREIDGRMDLWVMRPDGSGQTQITHTPDLQEGGAQFMPDSETIIYRAWRREDEGQRAIPMQIYTIKRDGRGLRQITTGPGVHWAPYPAPDGRHFAYVTFLPPRNFEIVLRDLATGEERLLTHYAGFDGFPAFSPDGKWMVFASSRDAKPGQRVLYTYLMDVSSLGLGPPRPK
jgi:TolB protein